MNQSKIQRGETTIGMTKQGGLAHDPLRKNVGRVDYFNSLTCLGPLCITYNLCRPSWAKWTDPHNSRILKVYKFLSTPP